MRKLDEHGIIHMLPSLILFLVLVAIVFFLVYLASSPPTDLFKTKYSQSAPTSGPESY